MQLDLVGREDELRWLLTEKYGVQGARQGALLDDLAALSRGVPIAYLIGWVKFLGCTIDLRYRPLIPRPETEYWVERWLTGVEKEKVRTVLDLCSGSGCIGAAALSHLPAVQVDAVDISQSAFKQTTINLESTSPTVGGGQRWRVIQSDLFSALRPGDRYDYIVCNPPYIDRQGEYEETILHEPEEALFAPDQGFAVIKRILDEVADWMKPDGELWMECATGQEDRLERQARSRGFDCVVHNDQFGRARYAVIRSASHRHS